jgi:anthrone oxygenase-like protein
MIYQILASLICGIFAGAAIYINLVEQPARLSCGVTLAVTEWRPSYKRGTALQAPLAGIGSVLAFLSWWLDKDPAWLAGGVILFAVIPFTLIVIFPTNKKLESDKLDLSSAQAVHLLRLWGSLHAVRSGLSLLAFIIFLLALTHKS